MKEKNDKQTNKPLLSTTSLQFQLPPETINEKVIYDSPEGRYVLITPAAYTKGNKQEAYKKMWDIAFGLGKNNKKFPFGRDHFIKLVHETNNQYDTHATKIILRSTIKGCPLNELDGMDMGYIPAEASESINPEIGKRITTGKIIAVSNSMYGKYYSALIILGYDGNSLNPPGVRYSNRFSKIKV